MGIATLTKGVGVPPPIAENAIAPLGDSRFSIINFDAARIQSASQCHLNWLLALSKQQFFFTGNWGVSGDTTTQMLTRLSEALASRPAFLVILGGINDPAAAIDTATTFANLATMADAAIARGVVPVLHTDPGSTGFTSDQCNAFHGTGGLNDLIRDYCTAHPEAILFDLAQLALATTNPIAFNSGFSYDGTHLDNPGCEAAGAELLTLLGSLVVAGTDPDLVGSLVSNADFATGTGGTNGTGNTGPLPASFTSGRDNANCSSVFSVNTRGDGSKEIVAALTANNTAGTLGGVRLVQALPSSGIVSGDIFRVGCQIDVDAGHTNLADLYAQLNFNFTDTTFLQGYFFRTSSGKAALSSGQKLVTMRSNKIMMPAGKILSSIQIQLGGRCVGAGSATLRFRKPWAKKYASDLGL
jgi:hypothetical protein